MHFSQKLLYCWGYGSRLDLGLGGYSLGWCRFGRGVGLRLGSCAYSLGDRLDWCCFGFRLDPSFGHGFSVGW
ncbi:hypothetical protein HOLleu_35983 [Holothuria leucospilota]|uniref:Uncharacterized protein n=1 Tax=Holothuria leucospilota TaxID=206669 RepID=A0A9Q0YLH9_HOLLE|nr:hypothetical protein HOLleu_35983 [Holothuria leucospilota]